MRVATGEAPTGSSVAETSATAAPSPEPVDALVDFEALQAENPDAYSWIDIPGAGISTAVLQSPADDAYYLTHLIDGTRSYPGSAFTEMANAKDYSDPVTVIYAHDDDSLFKFLHDYEDAGFFEANPYFYIYLPGRRLTYEVASAYKADDRHILNTHDFSSVEERESYFASVLDPASSLRNVRQGVTLDADSRIVQLSTCMLDEVHGSSRYLVTGVLVDERPTR